ncbi:uncharacterized protein LOC134284896 [Aedes albopictus]|uniref:Uncharacterized protein n=1 Tax=Aedes albopictus TaxID=7160 RepID=A0ABM1XXI3_AEDAL
MKSIFPKATRWRSEDSNVWNVGCKQIRNFGETMRRRLSSIRHKGMPIRPAWKNYEILTLDACGTCRSESCENPRKHGKVRIIWDAAARVKEVSLNSMLLSGPDLLTPLMSVLCQFRQRQFAITSDIRQMFHQLRIRKEDRQSQRFLWRTNPESTPDVYTMDVATFGATCSPCSAQYAENLNAADYEAEYPEAARAITKNIYVDDYLDSRDTIKEAVQLAVSVREVRSKAGFELRNWHSNAQEILNRIGAENSPEAVKSFTAEKITAAERILGMMWKPTEDLFVFSAQFHEDLPPLLSGEIVPTKRQVLRMVMSLFDPLGLISCFTAHGKILLQNIWRSGVGWDDPLIPRGFMDWQRWTKVLPELNRLQFRPNISIGPICI